MSTVRSPDDLERVLDRLHAGELAGPVLLEPEILPAMQHIGLFAIALFNPFGPTVNTVSLASFDGDWESERSILLRTTLHPFEDKRVQILAAEQPVEGTINFQHHIRTIWLFLANNARTERSLEWAVPLLETVPSGVVLVPYFSEGEWILRSGLAHLLRHAHHEVAKAASQLIQAGPDYWKLASVEMDEVNARLREGRLQGVSGDTPVSDFFPPLTSEELGSDELGGESFVTWWEIVSSHAYQKALHLQLPSAWTGAITHMPLPIAGDERTADYLAWWRLFTPELDGEK